MTKYLLAAAFFAPAHHHPTHHLRGCNTSACDRKVRRAWGKSHPMQNAVASWFYDAGATASGTHYPLGFASRTLPFGSRVRFCYARCATGRVEDRGPFIDGRLFDLNPALRDALGCPDLCSLRYRLLP